MDALVLAGKVTWEAIGTGNDGLAGPLWVTSKAPKEEGKKPSWLCRQTTINSWKEWIRYWTSAKRLTRTGWVSISTGSQQKTQTKKISQLAFYTWQNEQKVNHQTQHEKPDVPWLMKITGKSGYGGCIPIETFKGDPRVQVPRFLGQVRAALER